MPNLSHCPHLFAWLGASLPTHLNYLYIYIYVFNQKKDLFLDILDILDSLSFPHRWQEMSNSESEDNLDFQPLTQFLKCYGIYFQWPMVSSSWRRDITIMWTQDSNADFPWQYILYTRISCVCLSHCTVRSSIFLKKYLDIYVSRDCLYLTSISITNCKLTDVIISQACSAAQLRPTPVNIKSIMFCEPLLSWAGGLEASVAKRQLVLIFLIKHKQISRYINI